MIRALALILLGTQAAAGAPCPVLASFAADGALPKLAGADPVCSTSRVLGGGGSEDCYWAFALRSEDARAQFATLEAQLEACSTRPVTKTLTNVNHPDSFDQISGDLGGMAVSLSLKDKGALGQTLVFVRRSLQ